MSITHRLVLLLALAILGSAPVALAQDSLQLHFMAAVEAADLRLVKDFLRLGADVNMSVEARGPRYLFLISRRLYLDGLAKTRPGEIVYVSPIHANADHPDMKVLKVLRKRGANIEAGDSDGKTPLMYALRNPGGEEYALLLLRKGANYRSVDLAGNTVMHYAAYGGNIQGIRMTAGGGVDPNVRNAEGITPIHAAAVFSGVTAMEELMGLGGDIHARDSAGMGALHYAAAYGDRDRLDWILQQAPELNDEAANGYTPLDIARAAKNDDAVAYLKSKGGHYSAYRYEEMLAAMHQHDHQLLRQILQDGADPNRKTTEYPLVLAALAEDVVAVDLLLAAGADPNVLGNKGYPPLIIAVAKAQPSMALSLVKAGAQVTPAYMGECMDQLGKAEQVGFWADLVPAMLRALGDPNVRCGDLKATPLQYAAYLGKEELVTALLAAGADVHARDEQGWTALHWTVMKRDVLRLHLEKLRIAQALLAAGADVNAQATAPKSLHHTEPSLAHRIPASATPTDLLAYALPTDADLTELLQARGGKSGLKAGDYLENGQQLFAKREFQAAILDFDRAIAADAKLAEAYFYRARCKAIAGQTYAEVERDLDAAVRLKPQYPEALMARAKVRIDLQQLPGAERDVNAALALGFPKGEGLYWRGKVKLRSGDRDAACADFQQAAGAGFADAEQAIQLYCK